jgi:hypothetical protein
LARASKAPILISDPSWPRTRIYSLISRMGIYLRT